ncbi:hypothetical protein CLS_24300 [[Clostridium] cf. saccharolyticum K10]|nr:hypothetical protein CLS_24300 [[Clostridium] cf. saccharolyticum K10]
MDKGKVSRAKIDKRQRFL